MLSPMVSARTLGREIRAIRNDRGKSATWLSQQAETSQTHISSVESCKRRLSKKQLELVISALVVDSKKAQTLRQLHDESETPGWWDKYSNVLTENIEMLVGLEAGAKYVQIYDDAYVPALLQTPDYAHAAVTSAGPYLRSADTQRLLKFRRERQQRLDDPDFQLTAVINEGALLRQVGGREVMSDQLDHLLEIDGQCESSVAVHVLPNEAGAHRAQGETFTIMSFNDPDDQDAVYVDYTHASAFLEKQSEITKHVSAFGAVCALALSAYASRARIKKIRDELRR